MTKTQKRVLFEIYYAQQQGTRFVEVTNPSARWQRSQVKATQPTIRKMAQELGLLTVYNDQDRKIDTGEIKELEAWGDHIHVRTIRRTAQRLPIKPWQGRRHYHPDWNPAYYSFRLSGAAIAQIRTFHQAEYDAFVASKKAGAIAKETKAHADVLLRSQVAEANEEARLANAEVNWSVWTIVRHHEALRLDHIRDEHPTARKWDYDVVRFVDNSIRPDQDLTVSTDGHWRNPADESHLLALVHHEWKVYDNEIVLDFSNGAAVLTAHRPTDADAGITYSIALHANNIDSDTFSLYQFGMKVLKERAETELVDD
jgi:hypothetical protein